MSPPPAPLTDGAELLARVEGGLRLLTVPFPHFAGLARAVRPVLDKRVPSVGVFPSGRLAVNPDFVRQLNDADLVFVLAHELFHLALRTHDRAAGSDPLRFNFAHDYIINDILRTELGLQKIPAGGLDWPGARELSAEEIMLQMQENPALVPSDDHVWRAPGQKKKPKRGRRKPEPGEEGDPEEGGECEGGESGQEGEAGPPGRGRKKKSKKRGRPGQGEGEPGEGGEPGEPDDELRGDVFDEETEREMFPGEGDGELDANAEDIEEAAAKALALGKLMNSMKGKGRGADPGASGQIVAAIRGMYQTPWEAALQRWLESVSPGPRTFLRASRRGYDLPDDMVLPGRKREGWLLNVVLDTSGSMTEEIPRALGAIAYFCDAVGVDQIRLMQCDTAVTADVFLMPHEVAKYQISGYGGSDMAPALRQLADDGRVEATVVLTDGDIAYPQENMPYDVLWVLSPGSSPGFRPPYGAVIHMQPTRRS